MKTLTLSQLLITTQCRRNGMAGIMPVIGIVVGISILLLAFGLFRMPQHQNRANAEIRSASMSQLAVEVLVKSALATRSSLAVLSRLPVLRNIEVGGVMNSNLAACRDNFDLLVQSLELPVSAIWESFTDFERGMLYWKEIPQALLRRFLLLASFRFYEPFADDVEPDFGFRRLTEVDSSQILSQSRLVPESLQLLHGLAVKVYLPARHVAALLDSLPGLNSAGSSAADSAGSLLALMLDAGQFRAIALRNLHGKIMAMAGAVELIEEFAEMRDCLAIGGGAVFYSGPVFFDRRNNRSVWLVSVPVRDESRQPVACLTAMVDIGFLSQISGKIASGPDRLFFVDRSGIAIGHEDSDFVASKVNLKASLPALDRVDNTSFQRIVGNGHSAMLQAVTSVKKSGHRHLPDWYVVAHTRINTDDAFSRFIITVCVILLAATGMYVLSCCVVRITFFANEEMQ